LRFEE
jgi:uncharacterized protein YdaT